MILDQMVKISWHPLTKERYIDKGYEFTALKESFFVNVFDLPTGATFIIKVECDHCHNPYDLKACQAFRAKNHICSNHCKFMFHKVECKCAQCGNDILKSPSQIKKSVSGSVFCSNKCVGLFNGEQRSIFMSKDCLICGESFKVIPSAQEVRITCSVKCQGEWQSKYRIGDQASNFRGGDVMLTCQECNNIYSAKRHVKETSKFCSVFCKQENWKRVVISTDHFKKLKFEGNEKYRKTKSETLPEKMVRDWLQKQGIDFKQEQGFFRKYYADFYLPNTNIVIEVFGDYWHSNPNKYGDSKSLTPLNESQKEQITKDKVRLDTFKKYGFNVLVLWECDIYKDVDNLMKERLLAIFPSNDYTPRNHV